MTWKNFFESELKTSVSIDNAIDTYNSIVEDAEEYGFAAEAEFQGSLAWFHNQCCEKFEISRERFSLLRVGGCGWDHASGARLVMFSDIDVVYFIGEMIHYEAGCRARSSEESEIAANDVDVEWSFELKEGVEINIPEKVFECEKIVFKNGSFHENFYYGGYVVPAWLAQIIVESNPE